MFLHDGFGHETSHSCPHGKQPGEYCEPCNSSAIASGIPLNAPVSAKGKDNAEEKCTCGHTRAQHPQLHQDPANCRRGVCVECRCNEFTNPMIPKCSLINHRALAGCERQFQYCPYCGCNLAIVRSKAIL